MATHDQPVLKFALVVFPQFEPLDAFGPTETIHGLAQCPTFPYRDQISLSIIGPSLEPVNTGPIPGDPKPHNPRVQQTIVPTHTFDNPPEEGIDVLIVPGGFGAGPATFSGFEPNVDRVVQFIRDWYPKIRHLLTICTGSGIAARAGVLDSHRATTNKVAWSMIHPLGPKTYWVGHARWVTSDNAKLWTASGVSAGTDACLALLEHIYGKDEKGVAWADRVSDGMEWNRVRDSGDDPFAVKNRVVDVPPVAT